MDPNDPNAQQPPDAGASAQPGSNNGGGHAVPPQNQKTAPRRLKKAEKQRQAVEYRLMGASFTDIGQKLGMSKTRAFEYVKEALAEITAQTAETAEQYRQMQLLRIDKMLMGLMQAASAGSVFDVDRVIKLQQEQRELIPGLALAKKHEHGDMTDDQGNPTGAPIFFPKAQPHAVGVLD